MDTNEVLNVEEKTLENESVLKETFKVIWKIVLFALSIAKRICNLILWIFRPIITIIMIFFIVVLFFSTINLFMSYKEPNFDLWENLSIILSSFVIIVISALLYRE